MTPEERRQFEDMKKRLDELESTAGINKMTNQIFIDDKDVVDADITNTIGSEGGATFDFPDRWIVLRYRNKPYLVPAYNYTRQ